MRNGLFLGHLASSDPLRTFVQWTVVLITSIAECGIVLTRLDGQGSTPMVRIQLQPLAFGEARNMRTKSVLVDAAVAAELNYDLERAAKVVRGIETWR